MEMACLLRETLLICHQHCLCSRLVSSWSLRRDINLSTIVPGFPSLQKGCAAKAEWRSSAYLLGKKEREEGRGRSEGPKTIHCPRGPLTAGAIPSATWRAIRVPSSPRYCFHQKRGRNRDKEVWRYRTFSPRFFATAKLSLGGLTQIINSTS